MDQATTWFYGLQGDESKRREDELAPGGALVQLGKQLAPALGRDLTDEQAVASGSPFTERWGRATGSAGRCSSGRECGHSSPA
jgi:hypothetical protein